MQRTLRALLWMPVLLAFSAGAASAGESVFPGTEWARKPPAELQLDPNLVDGVAAALGGRGCFIKSGYVVREWGSQSQKGDWASSAKPVLSTLLMFAIHEGKVKGFDQPIADFGWELSPKDRGMTFRHLASMTGGYARPEAPGAAWAYNDFAIQLYQKTLFDRVFRGEPAAVAAAAERFGALQLQDGLVFRDTNRRMSASVRDFARIAWFWRHRGSWNGREVLPGRLFDDLLKPQVPKDLPGSSDAETDDYLKIGTYGGGSNHFTKYGPGIYGGNWWFNETGREHPQTRTWPDAPADTFMSLGVRGNCSVVIPSLDLAVIAANADWGPLEAGIAESVLNQRLRLIVAAGSPRQAAERAAPPADAAQGVDAADLPAGEQGLTIDGTREVWRPITITCRGPAAREEGEPNPFRDYRLTVTLTRGDRRIVVPGYFAADGRAAESGGTAGNCWRAHFVPDEAGEWTCRASFRTGGDVALSLDEGAGTAVENGDLVASFSVPSAASGGGVRTRGILRHEGGRYPRFSAGGNIFLKSGADSPENFLAYDGFDGTTPTHRYLPHLLDHRAGDPLWRGEKGRGIIGALNYLAGKGVNSLYFLTMNVRGDGKDVWPWTADTERYRFDCSKLDQWEIVFRHMDRLGMQLHVVLQEQENDQLLDGGELGPERKLYFRELVARFAHHSALVWNLGEENTNTTEQRKAFARYLREIDPYDHPIVVHTFPGEYDAVYEPLLRFDAIDGPSLQTNDTHAQTLRWVERSEAAGRPWFVCLDEIGPADTGAKPDADDYAHDELRTRHLWPHFMAGGAGVEWLFGYKYAHNDINLEDFRSRDHLWDLTRIAREFFERHVAVDRLMPADALVVEGRAHCLADPGRTYVVYLPAGGTASLDLGQLSEPFEVRWYDPRRGGALRAGSVDGIAGPGAVSIGLPPDSRSGRDWAALVTRRTKGPTSRLSVQGGIGSGEYRAGSAVPIHAPLAPSGQVFDRWLGENVTIADAASARTRVVLKAEDGRVEAAFRAAPPTPPVKDFTLINADDGSPVAGFDPIAPGAVIDLAALPTRKLSIRANLAGSVARVEFQRDRPQRQRSDRLAPFSLGGDSEGKYRPVPLAVGAHRISAVAFSESGQPSAEAELRFTVVDRAGP